ncbi:hypothetical protein V6N12_003558 [Hibiscus sabdariffa]|uniref:Inhibitor I9 domain-containing protein n=1 Tax=Hibiscus sabdariffa TaxID=183260 RepID=A0ABR2B2M8_9ROSI
MEDQRLSLLHCFLIHGLVLALLVTIGLSQSDKKSYIVYLDNLPKGGISTALLHNSMLQDVFGSDPVAKSVLYSYKRSFNGFVVELTGNEARKIVGNDGPGRATIKNFSPWTLSVAASTIDRKFLTRVKLGNGVVYEGVSVNTFDLKNEMYPIIHGRNAPNRNSTPDSSRFCLGNSLNPKLVKGKIVLCDRLVSGSEPLAAGAIGALFQNAPQDSAFTFPLPASLLDVVDGSQIFIYINSTR